jgi:hypothetical protein
MLFGDHQCQLTCSFLTVFLFEGSGSRFLTLDLIGDGT